MRDCAHESKPLNHNIALLTEQHLDIKGKQSSVLQEIPTQGFKGVEKPSRKHNELDDQEKLSAMNTSLHTTELPTTGARGLICEIQNGFLEEALPPVYSIISIIGFFSNALALWVFHFGTQKLNSITVYMKSLAISDLLLAFCLLFRAAYQNQSGPQIICKLVGIIFYLTMYVSIFLLSLICLDRYLKIIRPLQQFRIHTVPYSTAAVWAVWLICAGSMLLFLAEDDTKKPCSHRCFHFKKRNALGAGLNMAAVGTFFFLLGFFLYSYSKIAFKLRMVSLKKTHQGSKTTNSKAIMKTFVVLATFLICFAPYHVVRVPYILAQVEVISPPCVKQALHVANELALCVSALNCCFDPVIFYFLSSSFKKALLAAIRGKLRKALQKNKGEFSHRKSITESRMQGS